MITRADQLKNNSNFEADGKLFIVHCEQCNRENYAPAVASGTCAWCGWCEVDTPEEECDERFADDGQFGVGA